MTDFKDLISVADAAVIDVLSDRTVTVRRNGVVIGDGIKTIYDSQMQDIDSNGLIQGLRPGFTFDKADLTESTLQDGDKIIDGTRTWHVYRPLTEDETMVTVLVG